MSIALGIFYYCEYCFGTSFNIIGIALEHLLLILNIAWGIFYYCEYCFGVPFIIVGIALDTFN